MASAKRSASSAWGPPRTGHEDPPDVLEPRCLTTAMSHGESPDDLVDRRGEHGGAVARCCPPAALAAPAEDDEVGLLLCGGLDDALGRVPSDAHDRMDRRAVGRVVEDALEEPAGVSGTGRTLGQGHPLGDLDDAERRQLAHPPIEHGRTEADELLGGHRVGDRDEDAHGERRLGHQPSPTGVGVAAAVAIPPAPLASFQRPTRYGLSSSNSRAWRSTRSSAWSVVTVRFSIDEAADAPEVDRHECRDERLERGLRVTRRDDQVVDDPGPDVVREVERGDRIGHLQGRGLGRRHVAADVRAGSGRRPRGGLPRRPAPARSRAWPARASCATCPRGSASRHGTRTGGGACSLRAAAGR